MKLRVYAVLDKAVQAFLQPMTFRSEGEAKRAFIDAVTQEGSQFNRHKSDYAWCYLGTYDDNLGTFMSQAPVVVLEGATVVSAVQNADGSAAVDLRPPTNSSSLSSES